VLVEALVHMMNALEYMETRMEEKLDMEEIAKIAFVSPFHFQRMFHFLTGMSVAEYVRKRKLTLAAQELAASNAKVLDVALKYGYDSPESFSKAFRRIHGIAPSEARLPGVSLKAFPRLSFHISLKGDQNMDYRIEDKEAFTIVGKSLAVSCIDGENHREIPKFWGNCHQDGTIAKLEEMAPGELCLGVCLDMKPETGDFTYMIAVKADADLASGELDVREVPASTWAIFTSIGPMPDAIQSLFGRIFSEWFPATGYEHSGGPEIEAYTEGDTSSPDYRCEIWIPIIKQAK
jgi:AraC family transcriptional regulator